MVYKDRKSRKYKKCNLDWYNTFRNFGNASRATQYNIGNKRSKYNCINKWMDTPGSCHTQANGIGLNCISHHQAKKKCKKSIQIRQHTSTGNIFKIKHRTTKYRSCSPTCTVQSTDIYFCKTNRHK